MTNKTDFYINLVLHIIKCFGFGMAFAAAVLLFFHGIQPVLINLFGLGSFLAVLAWFLQKSLNCS